MSIKLYDKVALYGKKRELREYNRDSRAWETVGETVDYYVADANDKNQNKTGLNWSASAAFLQISVRPVASVPMTIAVPPFMSVS